MAPRTSAGSLGRSFQGVEQVVEGVKEVIVKQKEAEEETVVEDASSKAENMKQEEEEKEVSVGKRKKSLRASLEGMAASRSQVRLVNLRLPLTVKRARAPCAGEEEQVHLLSSSPTLLLPLLSSSSSPPHLLSSSSPPPPPS